MKIKTVNKKFFILAFIALTGIFLIYGIINMTFATSVSEEPSYIINIEHQNGDDTPSIDCSGNLFGNDLWYPGKEETGIIRIYNNSNNRVRIFNLGVNAELLSSQPGWDAGIVLDSFLSNMRITINSRKLLILPYSILENEALKSLLYKEDDNMYKGITLEDKDELSIKKDEFIDLSYTLIMDKSSGKELENLKASVSFTIKFNE